MLTNLKLQTRVYAGCVAGGICHACRKWPRSREVHVCIRLAASFASIAALSEV